MHRDGKPKRRVVPKKIRVRSVVKEHKQSYENKQPSANNKTDALKEDAPVPSAIGELTKDNPITTTGDSSQSHAKEYPPRTLKTFWKFIIDPKHSGALMAIFTILIFITGAIYAVFAALQWTAMKASNKLTRDTLQVSQRAYVTIGRKDGVIADFVIPKDPAQNAEIVVYFQNSGRLPAKFAWGTMVGFLAAGSIKESTGITYTHPFKGLPSRTRDIKTGSTREQGAADGVIAGDSIFVSTLGTISQKDLAELGPSNMGALILGTFEYCDELGTHSSRQFGLRYRSNAPVTNLSFDLANEGRSLLDMMPLLKSTATTEYLPPCETSAERERNRIKTR
jgi:hypothetical protein